MTNKPDYPFWIPDNTTGIVAPPDGKLDVGWISAEKPPYQYMNWYFNLISQWINFVGPGAPAAVIGTADYCSHATLAAAVADSNVPANSNILIASSAAISSTIALTKAGWKITALPGVTYSKSGVATCMSLQASGIEINRLRFSGFSTSGDKAIVGTSAWTYGRVLNCNFASCDTEVDDSAIVTVSQKPVLVGNITE